MLNKKKKILIVGILVLGVFVYVFAPKIDSYFSWRRVAEAAGTMPFQFGGTITFYQPACVSDPTSGVCSNCPMCTIAATGVGNYVCNGYQEIQFTPAGGNPAITNVCVPSIFKYVGGGTMPRIGGYILGGGASNILPWVIGISP